MKECEKSLALAKLMGWKLRPVYGQMSSGIIHYEITNDYNFIGTMLCPYKDNPTGLAQFAAILLRFPKVMCLFHQVKHVIDWPEGYTEETNKFYWRPKEPTQENILDAILQMHSMIEEVM